MAASSALPPPNAQAPRIRRWAAIWIAVVRDIATVGSLGYVVFLGWSDATNVYVTLSARALNPKLFIVARANEEGSEGKL